MATSGRICYAAQLGRVEYPEALELQMEVCDMKKRGFAGDVLLLLEHPPTITLGRNGKWHNLLVSDHKLEERGVRRFDVDRGGDITFHGPGQLVGYPLLRLDPPEQDVHGYMRKLEETLIGVLRAYGIEAGRNEKYTGVWTEAGKVAAMGVHISRWITRHGFALNVNTDLSFYDLIVPCGIAGKGVVSMASLLGHPVDPEEVAQRTGVEFGRVFGREVIWISGLELREKLDGHARQIAAS